MKFLKKLTIFTLFLSLILLFSSTILYAQTDEQVVLSSTAESPVTNLNENEKDLFLFDNSVTVDQSVLGNVFIVANDVTISGKVLGNVFVFAKNVNITSTGYINSSLFVCAENVTVNGVIFDMYSASSKLSISSNARILRDLTSCGNSLNFGGTVSRNATLTFNNIDVDSSNAQIGGNLTYNSNSENIPAEIVSGKLSFNKLFEDQSIVNSAMYNFKYYLVDLLKVIIVSLIVILIIVFATPKFAEKGQKIVENKMAVSIGYGALTLVAIPVACFLLFCTILGIIPALSILLAYLFIIMEMSIALVALPLAKVICQKINKNSKGMNILISTILVIILWLLEKIPVLGSIISLFISILALGILTYSIFHSKIETKSKKVVSKASSLAKEVSENVDKSKPSKKASKDK